MECRYLVLCLDRFQYGTNTYNFVVYDTNLSEVVRVNGISMWRAGTLELMSIQLCFIQMAVVM